MVYGGSKCVPAQGQHGVGDDTADEAPSHPVPGPVQNTNDEYRGNEGQDDGQIW